MRATRAELDLLPLVGEEEDGGGGGFVLSVLSGQPKPELGPRELGLIDRLDQLGFDPTVRGYEWRAFFAHFGAPIVERAISQFLRSTSKRKSLGIAAMWTILQRLDSPLVRSADAQRRPAARPPTPARDEDRAAAQLWERAKDMIGTLADPSLIALRDAAAEWFADEAAARWNLDPERCASVRAAAANNVRRTPPAVFRHDRREALLLLRFVDAHPDTYAQITSSHPSPQEAPDVQAPAPSPADPAPVA